MEGDTDKSRIVIRRNGNRRERTVRKQGDKGLYGERESEEEERGEGGGD